MTGTKTEKLQIFVAFIATTLFRQSFLIFLKRKFKFNRHSPEYSIKCLTVTYMLLTIGQSFRHFPTSHWLWTGEPGQYGSWHNFRILDRNRKFFSTKFPVNGTSLYSLFCSISVYRMTHIYDSWRVTRWWRGNPTLSYTSSIKFKFRSCSRTRINSDRSNNQSASILIFI